MGDKHVQQKLAEHASKLEVKLNQANMMLSNLQDANSNALPSASTPQTDGKRAALKQFNPDEVCTVACDNDDARGDVAAASRSKSPEKGMVGTEENMEKDERDSSEDGGDDSANEENVQRSDSGGSDGSGGDSVGGGGGEEDSDDEGGSGADSDEEYE